MGDIVDILCVVDGESLFLKAVKEGSGISPNDPAILRYWEEPIHKFCRMITRDKDALKENAHDDLVIRARAGETIRWRATSLTLDERYVVSIEGFPDSSWTVCDEPKPLEDFPQLYETTIKAGMAGSDDTYWLNFSVRSPDGDTRYFDWDPGIHVEA